MSESFWKRLEYFFGFLALFILFVLIVVEANIEIKDLDLWLHLGVGRYITLHHLVPQTDVLSFSIAGRPWINHEWLYQTFIYWVYQWGSFNALITLQVVVVVLTFLILLLYGYDKKRLALQLFALLLVLLVYELRFTLRPEIFSILFFSAFFIILRTMLEKKWSLVLLFIIQVIWSNTHGFFIVGPVVTLIFLTAEWLKRRWPLPGSWKNVGRLSEVELRHLRIASVLVLVACIFNPHFIRGALYPLHVLTSLPSDSRIFFEYIIELQRPLDLAGLFSFHQYPAFKLLFWISLISFFLNLRKLDIGLLIFWAVFLTASLSAVRNIVFFAIAAYFVFLENIHHLSLSRSWPFKFRHETARHCVSIALKIALILWMLPYVQAETHRGYFDFDTLTRKSEFGGLSQRNYPTKAVDFLVANKVRGNFFNDFNAGAYLIGRTSPDIKVYIDGRTEVYGAEFFKRFRRIWEGDFALLREETERLKINGVFLDNIYNPIPGKLLRSLYKSKEWALVYFNYDAVIFLRQVPENKALIDRYRIDLASREVPKIDILKLGTQNVTPYQQMARAHIYYNLRYYAKAYAEVSEAMKISPSTVETYQLIGKIKLKTGQYAKAFENFRKAKILDPDNRWTRYYLTYSLYQLGELTLAKQQAENWLERDGNPKAMYLLALILAKDKKYDESFEVFRGANNIGPELFYDIVRLGDLLFKDGRFNEAKPIFEAALRAKTGDKAGVHDKLGKCYEALGQKDRAVEQYQISHQLDGSESDGVNGPDTVDEIE